MIFSLSRLFYLSVEENGILQQQMEYNISSHNILLYFISSYFIILRITYGIYDFNDDVCFFLSSPLLLLSLSLLSSSSHHSSVLLFFIHILILLLLRHTNRRSSAGTPLWTCLLSALDVTLGRSDRSVLATFISPVL